MEPQTIVSLASTGVAALAVAASTVTTVLSLRAQRENTRVTLEAQERQAAAAERALRERAHDQDLRDKRAGPYLALITWADRLLAALDAMDETTKPALTVEEWNIAPETDSLLDLYASDAVHVRFAALRGKLMGLVDTSGPRLPQTVTWTETGDAVENVRIATGRAWTWWAAREAARDQAMDDAIDLIARVRAELQGATSRGYFIIWRLD